MVSSGDDKQKRRDRLERAICGLREADYELTSDPDGGYNCIAWAAGDNENTWDDEDEDSIWPEGAYLRDGSIESLMEAFSSLNFEPCDDGRFENGYEKVVLYRRGKTWTHAAKQLPDGRWSSKCGELDDIAHKHPSDVCCDAYGVLHCYMRRTVDSEDQHDETTNGTAA